MRPDREFTDLPQAFWANIRAIGQEVGYTARVNRAAGVAARIKVPTLDEIARAYGKLGLDASHLVRLAGTPTRLGSQVLGYLAYRARILDSLVEPNLMDVERARNLYERVHLDVDRKVFVPMNRQSGAMKKPAYFTGIVNCLISRELGNLPCDFNPQGLVTVTKNNQPYRTFARRVDGAFPGPLNPIAIWEIKEYYYTTTFGSRVADGVYETLLDGMEMAELHNACRAEGATSGEPRRPQHLLMIDAYDTWWLKGRSYLCRIIDMLHMGYVSEVLFGEEVVSRLPELVRAWKKEFRKRRGT